MSKQPAVLLLGFEPFADEPVNPSWQAVHALDGTAIEGHHVVAALLPTEFDASLRTLRAALRKTEPTLAIAVGLAGGRDAISLERVAINVADARIPDNAGVQPVDIPVVSRAPAAYFSTLPIKTMLVALREAGIAAEISQTAGTFVCNHVFYALMHAARRRPLRAGFVHVPYLPEQAARHAAPGMPHDQMVRALEIIVRCALIAGEDRRIAAGTVC